jgi:AP-1 complex subunit beta-1
VFILDSLSKYHPSDSAEAEGIIERVTPRLQHANSAVVMSAVKVPLPLHTTPTSTWPHLVPKCKDSMPTF